MKKRLDLPLLITLVILAFFVFVPMISAFEYSIRTPLEGGYGLKHYQWAIAEEDFYITFFAQAGYLHSRWLSL